MSTVIYLTDRSRIVTREECERKRFLNYDWSIDGAPMGIQRKASSLPLLNGIEIHEAHARVLAGQDIEAVVGVMRERYIAQVKERGVYGHEDLDGLVTEQLALLEALLRLFVKEWLPRILDEYDVVTIEKQMDWVLAPGLVQKLRFDTVLRRKADGQLVILDYKSMSYVSDAWGKKLERATQTALYVLAAQELFGEPVEIAYLGMMKGAYRKDTAKSSPWYEQKIQSSPLLYAYALKGDVGNIYQSEWTNKKGYKKVRTYEEMPIKDWVDWLWVNERKTAKELFVFNPPIAQTPQAMERRRELVVREELAYVDRVQRYHAMRDKALREGNEVLLKKAQDYLDFVAAPMRDEQCFKYGEESVCQFYGVCHTEGVFDRVLEDGEFEPRIPHHNTELEEAA